MSNSYLNAYAAFELPKTRLHMMFDSENSNLLMIGSYTSRNLKLTLPFIIINPTRQTDIGKEVVLNITATSKEDTDSEVKTCTQLIKTVVIGPNNMSVFGGDWKSRDHVVVDSPDEREFNVGGFFFGPYLNYSLNFNTTVKPTYDVEKRIRSSVKW